MSCIESSTTRLRIGFDMSHVEIKNLDIEFTLYAHIVRRRRRITDHHTGARIEYDRKGTPTIKALNNISLSIKAGDRIGLMGSNGSGKSTLLRAIAGIYPPVRGSLLTEGYVGSLIDIDLGIEDDSTGRDNYFVRGTMLGFSRSQLNQAFDEVVEFSGLAEYIDLPVGTYSSGMRFRLAFALATMGQPDILLLDEWLSVSDQEFKLQVERRLDEIIEKSDILVHANHSRAILEKTCNRFIVLHQGSIVADSRSTDVLDSYFNS